jgi:hypothetical protein
MHCSPIRKTRKFWEDIFEQEWDTLYRTGTSDAAAEYLAQKYGMSKSTMKQYLVVYGKGKLFPRRDWRKEAKQKYIAGTLSFQQATPQKHLFRLVIKKANEVEMIAEFDLLNTLEKEMLVKIIST